MIIAKDILSLSILEDEILARIKSLVNRCGYRPMSDAYSVAPRQDEIYLGSSQYKIDFNQQLKKKIKKIGKEYAIDMRKLCDEVYYIVSKNMWLTKKYSEVSHFFVESGGSGNFPFRFTVGFWISNEPTFGVLGISTYINTKELTTLSQPGLERFKKEFEEKLFTNLGFLDTEIKSVLINKLNS